jgi:methionine-rich copper-binding protein CopC
LTVFGFWYCQLFLEGAMGGWSRCQTALGLGILSGVLGLSDVAAAGALRVRESAPAAEAIIHGGHAEFVIRFDGLVDHAASRLAITRSGHVVQSLVPDLDSAPDVLFSSSETPAPGHYVLHWQARSAVDGTVSSGDIPFSVTP